MTDTPAQNDTAADRQPGGEIRSVHTIRVSARCHPEDVEALNVRTRFTIAQEATPLAQPIRPGEEGHFVLRRHIRRHRPDAA